MRTVIVWISVVTTNQLNNQPDNWISDLESDFGLDLGSDLRSDLGLHLRSDLGLHLRSDRIGQWIVGGNKLSEMN